MSDTPLGRLSRKPLWASEGVLDIARNLGEEANRFAAAPDDGVCHEVARELNILRGEAEHIANKLAIMGAKIGDCVTKLGGG